MPLRSEVGDHISCIGLDRDRCREGSLLPTALRFIGEGHGAERRSRTCPEIPHMRPAVLGAPFVKPDAGNEAVSVGTELQPEFHSGVPLKYRNLRRVVRWFPYRESCG